jgi:hypothetical protein
MSGLMKRIAHAIGGIGEKPALLTEGGLLLWRFTEGGLLLWRYRSTRTQATRFHRFSLNALWHPLQTRVMERN